MSIDADHDAPFIFRNSGPQSGSTLLPGANTFVTFPNVTAGEVTITPDHPDADVDIRVENGHIRNDLVLEDASGDSEGRVRGRVGKGGTPIRLRTSNGTVSVR